MKCPLFTLGKKCLIMIVLQRGRFIYFLCLKRVLGCEAALSSPENDISGHLRDHHPVRINSLVRRVGLIVLRVQRQVLDSPAFELIFPSYFTTQTDLESSSCTFKS